MTENGRDNKGRFQPGNTVSVGNKGNRRKLQEDFLRDFHEAWLEHGKAALLEVAQKDPGKFVTVAASLMPKNDTLTVAHLNFEMLTDEELVRIIRQSEGGEDTSPSLNDPAKLN